MPKAHFTIEGKNIELKLKDFYELLQIVKENLDYDKEKEKASKEGSMIHQRVLRPSKIYANLASRACRSSIMIGTDLNLKTMKKVVTNLSTLESPWNCPHG